jgi:hypothetical protein
MSANHHNRILVIAIPLALLTYLLPWVVSSTHGLTLGAYDLAEWLSLHPATHPSRLPSLLLRGQLLIFTLIIAYTTTKPLFTVDWWLRLLAVLVLTVAQLPPPEFLAWTGDQNQRQQALLAGISLLGGVIGLTGIFYSFRRFLLLALFMMGLLSSIYGLLQAFPRMREFGLAPTVGIGGISFVLLYGVLLVWTGYSFLNANRVTH